MIKDLAPSWFTNPFICNIAPQLMANEDFPFQSQTLLQFKKFLLCLTHSRTPGFTVAQIFPILLRQNQIYVAAHCYSNTESPVPDVSAGRQATGSTQSVARPACRFPFVRFLCALNFRRHLNALLYRDKLPYQGIETSLQLKYNHLSWGMILLVEGCSHSILNSSLWCCIISCTPLVSLLIINTPEGK